MRPACRLYGDEVEAFTVIVEPGLRHRRSTILKWLVSVVAWRVFVAAWPGRGGLWCPSLCRMADAVMLERIATRRAEPGVLQEDLVEKAGRRTGEGYELSAAESVVRRISEQGFCEYELLASPEARAGGRSVLLLTAVVAVGPDALLPDDQRIWKIPHLTRLRDSVLQRPWPHRSLDQAALTCSPPNSIIDPDISIR